MEGYYVKSVTFYDSSSPSLIVIMFLVHAATFT